MSAQAPENPSTDPSGSGVTETDTFIEFGAKPTMGQYLSELWDRREFSVYVPYQELRVQKMNTVLGQLWHFLNPAMTVVIYYIIFALILKADRGVDNYIGYLVIGILMFTVTQRIMMDAIVAIERDAGLIKSVEFPRALLPISAVFGQTMAFLPSLPVLVVALLITGELPTLRWLLIPLVLLGQLSMNLGLAMILARAGFAVRDLKQLVDHMFRLLFYGSGVLFPLELFIDNEAVRRAFAINPLYDLLVCARWVLQGSEADMLAVYGAVFYAAVLPAVGLVVFMRGEHKYGGSQ